MRVTFWRVAIGALFGVLLAAPVASAQDFGVKAGINFANLRVAPDVGDDVGILKGLVAGAFIASSGDSRIGFQIDGLFNTKGYVAKGGGQSIRARAIDVPVVARIRLSPTGKTTRFFALAGGSVGFRLTEDARSSTDEPYEETDPTVTKKYDGALVLGALADIKGFIIDFRYVLGLTEAFDPPDEDYKVKHTGVMLTAGFRFGGH